MLGVANGSAKHGFPLVHWAVVVCSYDDVGTQVCDCRIDSAFTVQRFVSICARLLLSGHPSPRTGCPLSGVKRKSASASPTSEFDPEADIAAEALKRSGKCPKLPICSYGTCFDPLWPNLKTAVA